MGQRFQSVFILPPVDMGTCGLEETPNPNNRKERVLVFHSQWCYGLRALGVNLAIMNRLKEAIKKRADCGSYGKTKEDFINHYLEKSLRKSITWAGLQDLHHETNFIDCGGFVYGDEGESLGKELYRQDNNNGFFVCEIKPDLSMNCAFISGLEDEDTHRYKMPIEYLNLFYSVEEMQNINIDVLKLFGDFKHIGLIEEDKLKPIIKELNQLEELRK